jgi:hypothetical protein
VVGVSVNNLGILRPTGYVSIDNVLIGVDIASILTSTRNTFVGYRAGRVASTGQYNQFFGFESGNATTTGNQNGGFGYQALPSLTSGSRNVGVGNNAGVFLTTGSDNVYIGSGSAASAASAANEIVISGSSGATAGYGSNTIRIGNASHTDTYLSGTTRMQASTTTRAGLRILSGVDPSSPVTGDLWFDGTNLKFYDGTTTHNLF